MGPLGDSSYHKAEGSRSSAENVWSDRKDSEQTFLRIVISVPKSVLSGDGKKAKV